MARVADLPSEDPFDEIWQQAGYLPLEAAGEGGRRQDPSFCRSPSRSLGWALAHNAAPNPPPAGRRAGGGRATRGGHEEGWLLICGASFAWQELLICYSSRTWSGWLLICSASVCNFFSLVDL